MDCKNAVNVQWGGEREEEKRKIKKKRN
jgi:hypothetical protein